MDSREYQRSYLQPRLHIHKNLV